MKDIILLAANYVLEGTLLFLLWTFDKVFLSIIGFLNWTDLNEIVNGIEHVLQLLGIMLIVATAYVRYRRKRYRRNNRENDIEQ